MKYVLMCIVVLCVCIAIGIVLVKCIEKILKKKPKRSLEVILGLLFCMLLIAVVTLVYLGIYYRADEQAFREACDNKVVNVTKIDGGYFFDGPGNENALIFYSGAKVEDRAYASLMARFAENGIDCFIVKVPFNMAMFNSNGASKFIQNFEYDNWILCGHSMGGVVASGFAVDHADLVSSIVMLSSYPTKKIPDSLGYISIYGSNDKCLGMEVYDDAKQYWPQNSEEVCIKGGNHSQMGNYGIQKGDGKADISADEQQKAVVEAVNAFFIAHHEP